MHGACPPETVAEHLKCHEGTHLTFLAEAAIEAAKELLATVPIWAPCRIVFILNTDGEAGDGVQAASKFNFEFAEFQRSYPEMMSPRTFVLGIGGNHDQKVLGAMSVGEASYLNYEDDELHRLELDDAERVLPELNKTAAFTVTVSSGRKLTRYMHEDCIKQELKRRRGVIIDEKAGIRQVITLCESGVRAIKIGTGLSNELERDFMEVLGSGGFNHWTRKKKSRIVGRALEQVNANSIYEVDAEVYKLLQQGLSSSPVNDDDKEEEEEGEVVCWFTGLTAV